MIRATAHHERFDMKLTPQQMESRQEKFASRFTWILGATGMVFSIVHVVCTYTIPAMVVGSTPWSIATAAVVFLTVAAVLLIERPNLTWASVASGLLALVGVLIGAALGGFIFYAGGATIRDLYLWSRNDLIGDPNTSTLRLPLITTVILVVGAVLFGIREKCRAFYGTGEAAAGLWIASQKISNPSPSESTPRALVLALLTASIYLIVRGLDNINVGLNDKDENKRDKWAAKIVNWLKKPWSPGPI